MFTNVDRSGLHVVKHANMYCGLKGNRLHKLNGSKLLYEYEPNRLDAK